MKAAVIERRDVGGFAIREFPDPIRQPGEALMRVHSSSINRVDLYMRDCGAGITHELPLIGGVDGVGEIVECDPGGNLSPGMRVALYSNNFCGTCRYCLAGEQPLCTAANIAGEHRHGSFAEYIAMPEKCFLPLPDTVSYEDAGVLHSAYMTAFRMLFGKDTLLPGETVLVIGAGGGVAVACIQLAVLCGARVLVTSSTREKIAKAIALGADGGINYRSENVVQRVLELTGGEGVDMVIDSVGEATWADSLRSLRRGGRLVTCGATTGSNPPVEIQRMFIRQLAVYGSTGGNLNEMREVLKLAGSGRLKPVIDSRFSLDRIQEAFARLEAGDQFGKISISVAC